MVEYESLEAFVKLLEHNTWKKIKLPTLDIEIDVLGNRHFHDDGEVENLDEHTDKLLDRYSTICEYSKNSGRGGRFLTINYHGERHAHIYYTPLSMYDSAEETFIKGHEETHALLYLAGINPLKKALGTKNDSINDEDEETIAYIGGLYATQITHPMIYIITKQPNIHGGFIRAANWLMENSQLIQSYNLNKTKGKPTTIELVFC